MRTEALRVQLQLLDFTVPVVPTASSFLEMEPASFDYLTFLQWSTSDEFRSPAVTRKSCRSGLRQPKCSSVPCILHNSLWGNSSFLSAPGLHPHIWWQKLKNFSKPTWSPQPRSLPHFAGSRRQGQQDVVFSKRVLFHVLAQLWRCRSTPVY